LPILGALIAISGLLCIRGAWTQSERFHSSASVTLGLLVAYVVIAAIGGVTTHLSLRCIRPRMAGWIFRGAAAALIARDLLLQVSLDMFSRWSLREQALVGTEVALMISAVLLWGSEIAQIHDPHQARSRRLGLQAAMVLSVGLVLEFFLIIHFNPYARWPKSLFVFFSPSSMFETSIRCLPYACLLLACVERFWPGTPTADRAPSARRIHTALLLWFAAEILWWVYLVAQNVRKSRTPSLDLIANSVLTHALPLLIALTVALSFGPQESPPTDSLEKRVI
jgi:hypothetical protein